MSNNRKQTLACESQAEAQTAGIEDGGARREAKPERQQAWERENALAILAYNDRIRSEGVVGEEYSRFG